MLIARSFTWIPGRSRQGHLRSGSGQGYQQQQLHRRALPPAPVLPQSLRSVAPPIYYNSSGNSSTSSELDPYVKRSLSSVNPKNRPAPIGKNRPDRPKWTENRWSHMSQFEFSYLLESSAFLTVLCGVIFWLVFLGKYLLNELFIHSERRFCGNNIPVTKQF